MKSYISNSNQKVFLISKTQKNLQPHLQQVDWEYFMPIISSVQEKGFFSGLADEIWLVLKLGFMLLVAFYIVSIPMQLVSYYIILVIRYFKNYGQGYRKIVNFFLKTWRSFS